jgi:hypothetical protein
LCRQVGGLAARRRAAERDVDEGCRGFR